MVIDTYQGRILHSAEIDEDLKRRHPYKLWLERNVKRRSFWSNCLSHKRR